MELKINKDYKIVPIDSVFQDPENAKVHDAKDIAEKKASLEMFGFTRPILVNSDTNIIAAGNGIHIAAKELGYKEIPVIMIPMSAIRAKSLGISDNRLGDNGKYDLDQFNVNISEIAEWEVNLDWKALGFEKGEIDLLLASMNTEITDNIDSSSADTLTDISDEDTPAKPIKLTKAQREVFEEAFKKIRKDESDFKLSEGRAIELISANFLSERGTE